MVHVLLDTCIYRSDPDRRSTPFRVLARLAREGRVKIHVPQMVQQELISAQQSEYEKLTRDASKALRGLGRKRMPLNADEPLSAATRAVRSLEIMLQEFAASELTRWWEDVGAVIHEIAPDHGVRVVRSYFEGAPPFKARKRRDDFPDAFIWECFRDIGHQSHPCVLITDDGGLVDAATSTKLEVFRDLTAFLESEFVADVVVEHLAEEQADDLKEVLRRNMPVVQEAIGVELRDLLDGELISLGKSYAPDPVRIDWIYDVQSLDLDLDDVELVDQSVLRLLFWVDVEVSVEYTLPRSRAREIPVKDREYMDIRDVDELTVAITDTAVPHVRGELWMELGTDLGASALSKGDLERLVQRSEIGLQAIEVE
jgi:hypothetical protein